VAMLADVVERLASGQRPDRLVVPGQWAVEVP
jgi:hypothetical protein